MREKTIAVQVGNATIGGGSPVLVQSMTTTSPKDIEGSAKQIIDLANAGCELARITVPTLSDAEKLKGITEKVRAAGVKIPISADIHFQPKAAFESLKWVEKVRINPGNFAGSHGIFETFSPFVNEAKKLGKAIRIGVNHGSLSARILAKFGNTPLGMVESAFEYLSVCEAENFDQVIFSLKASRPKEMVEANRLMAERLRIGGHKAYPFHLGVTEAGEGEDGRIKSAVGIGALLIDGIGDTIRVSLTENPVNEISVAFALLQAAGLRKTKAEFISCPGCGRTLFDLQGTTAEVKQRFSHLKHLSIAVMGCIVNGPGEMAGADFGYVGAAQGKITLYEGTEPVRKNIAQSEALDALENLIKERGKWNG
ncbi:MAG: (E)-4-hydroxy-3-methylbut-2-enyl-diphosphate synthase [Fibromonadaceae bacterium]|jgi:(E)-4-hydroxy-3-methylbut-2-enyl-diphosphate synthase|nr:(E)-4-hydroxy-3-methylbut-2-enyl-diphosphate synthase [Fibromonadaceae bacterium]